MKISKRILSVVLVVVMALSVSFVLGLGTKANAASGVQTKINEILSKFPAGSYFTANSKSCAHSSGSTCNNCRLSHVLPARGLKYNSSIYPDGYTCYAFASFCFGYIFNKSFMPPGSVGVGSSGRVSNNQGLHNIFKNAKTGDFVYCWKPGNETPAHYAIFVNCDANGVTLLHNNIGGSSSSIGKIAYGYITYENLRVGGYGYNRIDIYRAVNYDAINGAFTDTQKPSISNIKVSSVSSSGYTVTCNVSDNVKVTRVAFPTWTHANGQDDLIWKDGSISGNTATFRVNRSDHKNESGAYATHIYVYDAAGNNVVGTLNATVPVDDIISCDDARTINEKHYSDTTKLRFHGWAFSNKGKTVSFKYILDSNSAVSVKNVDRPDVKKAYSGTCSFANVGYDFTLDLSKFSKGKHTMKVVATSSSGVYGTISNLIFYVDGHSHSYTSTVTTQPTCAKEGVKTYKCTCGASYTEKIAKKSHSYTSTVTTQPTCAKEGVKTFKCSCGASYTQAIAKVAHSYTVTDVKASKDQPAGKKYTCKVCGYSYFQKLEKTWSGWSTTYPTGVDAKYIESKKEYRYSDYQTTTSYNSSVSGYTYLKSTWEKEGSYVRKYVPSWPSGYPTTSDFYKTYNKSRVSSSETSTEKIVANEPKVYGYIYYHWCRGTYTGGPINRTTKKAKTGEFCKYHAFISDVNPNTLTCADDGSRIIARESLCKDTYWYYPVTMYSQTYTKYKKLNTFYRWTDYSSWSSTAYTASSTRKVETRTLYRYVTFDPDAYVEEAKPLGTTSKITASKTSSSVTLNWNAVEGASGYRVFQKVDGKWKTLTNTTKHTYTINNLKANTKYNFAIRAYVLDGNEKVMAPKYKSVSATTSRASSSKPGQVKNVKATVYTETVNLSWGKVSNATGYEVLLYNSSTKKYTSIGKVAKTSCKVKNLTPGTVYQFAVRAYNSSGNGKISAILKVTTKLATPVVKISSTKTKANLSWADIKGESGYAIYMATSKNGKYTHLANYKANSTKATKSNLKSGKTYYFKIRAYKKNSIGTVYGAYSAVKSVKIK